MTRALTEQSINTTGSTNEWNAWISNGMKKGATYYTNNINDCHSNPLKTSVEARLFSIENFYLVFEFNK